jgi:hypothetical protein
VCAKALAGAFLHYAKTKPKVFYDTIAVSLRLERVLALRERGVLLRLANSLRVLLGLGQRATNGARLLLSQVERHVLGARVRLAQRVQLLVTHHREGLRDRQSHLLDLAKLTRSTTGHFRDAELREFRLQDVERLLQLLLGALSEFVASEVDCAREHERERSVDAIILRDGNARARI